MKSYLFPFVFFSSEHKDRAFTPRSVNSYMIQFPWDVPSMSPIELNFFRWYESLVSDISSNSRMIQTHNGCTESIESIFIRNGSERALKRETFFIITSRGIVRLESPSSPPIVIRGSRTSGGILAGIAGSVQFVLQAAFFIVQLISLIRSSIFRWRCSTYREYRENPQIVITDI